MISLIFIPFTIIIFVSKMPITIFIFEMVGVKVYALLASSFIIINIIIINIL